MKRTTKTHARLISFASLTTLLLVTAGCERSAAPQPAAKPAGSPVAAAENALPAGLWLKAAPADARPVAEVKKSAQAGQDVVVFGRIGGRKDPFVAGRAMFMLADAGIPSCREKHEDGCPTPWDFCCEPKETILAGTTTVQVVDADGKPLKCSLGPEQGLKPLANVVVAGRIASAGDNVVIDATGIYVEQ